MATQKSESNGCLIQIGATLVLLAMGRVGAVVFRDVEGAEAVGFVFVAAILIAIAYAFYSVANKGIASRERAEQMDRDRVANRIMAELKAGLAPAVPFVLYLRSFKITGASPENFDLYDPNMNYGIAPSLVMQAIRPSKTDFEKMLADAVPAPMVLIGLGKPSDLIGAGRCADDGKWEDAVELLAAHAETIAFVPATTEGVMWELQHLAAKDLFKKTVFFLPTALDSFFGRAEIRQCFSSDTARSAPIVAFENGSISLMSFSDWEKKVRPDRRWELSTYALTAILTEVREMRRKKAEAGAKP